MRHEVLGGLALRLARFPLGIRSLGMIAVCRHSEPALQAPACTACPGPQPVATATEAFRALAGAPGQER